MKKIKATLTISIVMFMILAIPVSALDPTEETAECLNLDKNSVAYSENNCEELVEAFKMDEEVWLRAMEETDPLPEGVTYKEYCLQGDNKIHVKFCGNTWLETQKNIWSTAAIAIIIVIALIFFIRKRKA